VSKHLLILLLAAIVSAGCHHTVETENPQPLQARSFAQQWATVLSGTDDNPITAVHLSDQFVFAYRQDGSSTVMDRQTGRLLHVDHPEGGQVRLHPPVVLGDRIIYPTTDRLEVFDLQGRYVEHPARSSDYGVKPVSQRLPFAVRSDAVGQGKYLFFGADFEGGGRGVEVDLTRPYVPAVWELMMAGSAVSAAPALSKDAVYFAADNGSVQAVTIDGREPLWTLPGGTFRTGGVIANLADDQTSLYIASTDSKLYCLNKANARLKWQFFGGDALRTPPVVTKDTVYQYVPGTGLVAIDKNATGNPGMNREARWVAGDAVKYLAEDNVNVYALSRDHHLLAVDKHTGHTRFTSKRKDLVGAATSTKGDGMIYIATGTGRVLAARPVLQTGSVGEIVLVPVSKGMDALAMAQ